MLNSRAFKNITIDMINRSEIVKTIIEAVKKEEKIGEYVQKMILK